MSCVIECTAVAGASLVSDRNGGIWILILGRMVHVINRALSRRFDGVVNRRSKSGNEAG